MEKILQGLPGVVCYLDDILVMGKDEQEHLTNLSRVLERLSERELRLKKSKCCFMLPSVQYLGHTIGKEGLHVTTDKVTAIIEAPKPADQKTTKGISRTR